MTTERKGTCFTLSIHSYTFGAGRCRNECRLDVGVRIGDDGEEDVEKHEEHNEDVKEEINGTEDAMRRLDLLVREIPQENSELSEGSIGESRKLGNRVTCKCD